MSFDTVIEVSHLSKSYQIYDRPQDRLKQSLYPRLQRLLGRPPGTYFQEFRALHDISFEIKKGETVGIIGRNGSGKSTLLQLICGTLNPTGGTLRTHGRIAALLELGSGFNPEFTGHENVYMNAALLGLSKEQVDARYDDIVAFADIGAFIHQPTKTYSSGMMVRLAFAVIAHVDADILIIDEALAVGDAFFTQKCMRFLRDFMKTGTVLFVSHDTSAVRSLCTRAVWLDKGRSVMQGSPKDVCEAYLEAFYEAQQGKSVTAGAAPEAAAQPAAPLELRDPRQDMINHSNLRNDIRLFAFDPTTASFGKGGAQVTQVQFTDIHGRPLSWIIGGEDVVLHIEVTAHVPLTSPIVGFYVKDRLGQDLFGDNTYLSHFEQPLACEAGERFMARFTFNMPRLRPGDYTVTVAIADGTQDSHVQHQWVHDALVFRSETSSVAGGIVGIPMRNITMNIIPQS